MGGQPGTGGEMAPGTGGEMAGTGGMPANTGGTMAMGTGGTVTPGTGGTMAGTGGTSPPGTGGSVVIPATGGTGGSASPDGGSGDLGSPNATCGSTRADLTSLTGARGIAIDDAGVIYFTRESGTQAWIGRLRPGAAIELSWRALPANAQPRVLRVDSARNILFVPCLGGGVVYAISTASGFPVYTGTGFNAPHGVAVAADGFAYISGGDGHIEQVLPDLSGAQRAVATNAPVFAGGQRPLGLAFGPSGHLFIGSSNGAIKRYRVQGGKLVEGVDYGTFSGPASDLAFDVEGRLFIAGVVGSTARQLYQVQPNGGTSSPVTQVMGRLSGLAFGRGTLACRDLYVGAEGEATKVWTSPQLGLALP
jgi:hypothetical protein